MKISIEHHGKLYTCDTNHSSSLAIALDFDGPQPNFFGTSTAAKETLQMGQFVASTRQGSGCNVEILNIIPHCNGTHSETVSHIVDDMVSIGQTADTGERAGPFVAVLITVPTSNALSSSDSYRPELEPTDTVITASSIAAALASVNAPVHRPQALIIRTTPNTGKQAERYDSQNQPAFFSVQAIQAIVESGITHLLVDIPSIDRIHDDGLLTNHHLFWNVPEGTHRAAANTWKNKTITEMIFVSDDLADGLYLLNLQIPSFTNTDAAPSRPIVYPLHE